VPEGIGRLVVAAGQEPVVVVVVAVGQEPVEIVVVAAGEEPVAVAVVVVELPFAEVHPFALVYPALV